MIDSTRRSLSFLPNSIYIRPRDASPIEFQLLEACQSVIRVEVSDGRLSVLVREVRVASRRRDRAQQVDTVELPQRHLRELHGHVNPRTGDPALRVGPYGRV